MRFGVHLPIMGLGGQRFDVDHLARYVETAVELGFEAVCANDHVVFGSPWLDGPTALSAVVSCSGNARLVTTVANPVVRGPAVLAKALAALDVLSTGRVVAGLAPGSSESDYASVGVPFAQRWERFDEAVRATRALLRGDSFVGTNYTVDEPLTPLPVQPGGPPLWLGSWGSDAGMRRVARLGDGWLASAYNLGADEFRTGWASLWERLAGRGRDVEGFATALGTMWFHIDALRADDVLTNRLAPVVHRPVEQLLKRLAFGTGEAVLERSPPSGRPVSSGCSCGRWVTGPVTTSSSCTGSATRSSGARVAECRSQTDGRVMSWLAAGIVPVEPYEVPFPGVNVR